MHTTHNIVDLKARALNDTVLERKHLVISAADN